MEGLQDDRYREAAATYGAALERLARAYEADPDHRRDLLQEIHLALWRSFSGWDERCTLRTWVYRVAHNAAASHVIRQRRMNSHVLVSLEELDHLADPSAPDVNHQEALSRLLMLVQRLKPVDRQVILPAGVKESIPGVDIGRDQYCMKIGGAPAYNCERKTITAKENN